MFLETSANLILFENHIVMKMGKITCTGIIFKMQISFSVATFIALSWVRVNWLLSYYGNDHVNNFWDNEENQILLPFL